MLDREMHFLNAAGFGGRHHDGLIHDLHEPASVASEQGNDGDAALPSRLSCREQIGTLSACTMENQKIGRPAESFHLSSEYLLEAHVIGGRGEEGGIGRQRERGEAGAFLLMADDVFRGDMLRICGAAAVPGEEQRAPPSQSLGVSAGDPFDLWGQRGAALGQCPERPQGLSSPVGAHEDSRSNSVRRRSSKETLTASGGTAST